MIESEKWRWDPEALRQRYPKGTVIRLYTMDKEWDMPDGLLGRVTYVDDIGQIHMAWENGSTLALMEGIDCFKAIETPSVQQDDPCR